MFIYYYCTKSQKELGFFPVSNIYTKSILFYWQSNSKLIISTAHIFPSKIKTQEKENIFNVNLIVIINVSCLHFMG